MATLRWYLTGTTVDGWRTIDESTQSAGKNTDGWVVSTGATNHSEYAVGVERAASTFTGTTVPDGTLDTTLKDAFRTTNAYNGDFANANWTFDFSVQATTAGGAQDGRIRFRLIKANADGSSATEITSGQQSATIVSNVAASGTFESSLTLNPGAFNLNNQYLFIQIAWERTGAGGMTSSDINFVRGSSTTVGTRIVSADFTASATTYTKTASLSSLLQKQNNLITASVATLLQKGETCAASVNSLLSKTSLRTVNANAELLQAILYQLQLNANSILREVETLTWDADTVSWDSNTQPWDAQKYSWWAYADALLVTGTTTYTIAASLNSYLARSYTKTASANALLQKMFTASLQANALAQKLVALTASSNALLRDTELRTVGMAALLQKNIALTASLNSVLQKMFTVSASAGAALRKTEGKTASTSSWLAGQYSKVANANSLLLKALTKTASINSMLQRQGLLRTVQLDSLKQKEFNVVSQVDSALQKLVLITLSANTMLERQEVLSLSFDAIIALDTIPLTAFIDGLLQATPLMQVGFDALLSSSGWAEQRAESSQWSYETPAGAGWSTEQRQASGWVQEDNHSSTWVEESSSPNTWQH